MVDDLARGLPWIALAYAIGCVATGYYLVRLRTGADVRGQGSGSSGATNAMRVLGRTAFAAVFLLDVAKGALAVGLARWLGSDEWTVVLAGAAVIAGHIWPAQLGFRGGKGVATAFGAALAVAPLVALGALLIAGAALAARVRFVMAGLLGTACAPLVAVVVGESGVTVAGLAIMAMLVVIGHRRNLAAAFSGAEPVLRRSRTGAPMRHGDAAILANGERS